MAKFRRFILTLYIAGISYRYLKSCVVKHNYTILCIPYLLKDNIYFVIFKLKTKIWLFYNYLQVVLFKKLFGYKVNPGTRKLSLFPELPVPVKLTLQWSSFVSCLMWHLEVVLAMKLTHLNISLRLLQFWDRWGRQKPLRIGSQVALVILLKCRYLYHPLAISTVFPINRILFS